MEVTGIINVRVTGKVCENEGKRENAYGVTGKVRMRVTGRRIMW